MEKETMERMKAILAEAQAGALPQLSSEEYEDRRVAMLNDRPGDLPGEDCPLCKNKGYIAKSGATGGLVTLECSCMGRRRTARHIERSGLAETLRDKTFTTFQTPEEWQRKALEMAQRFTETPEGKWFIAAGQVGSGKTHLCTAICKELLDRGVEVRYMRWRDDAGRIKAAVNNTGEYNNLIDPLKTVPVLYIDDFFKAGKDERTGKPKVLPGDVNLAFELLNYRYGSKSLVTIISTELTVEQILDIDQGVGSRIYERSKEYYLKLTGQEKNWRLRA